MMNFSKKSLGARGKGFTLIEMMIAVAVIAILAAVAFPSYQDSIRNARRVDAKNAVLDLAARQEKFFSTNNTYSVKGTDLGYSTDSAINIDSGSGVFYVLNLTQTATTNFEARAVPSGSQQRDTGCYTFAINNLGSQRNLNAAGAEIAGTNCW